MDVKTAVTKAYDGAADLWHKTRETSFDNYKDIKDLKQNRPHLFIEKPAMTARIPDLTGKDVLCLGCGSGEECDFILSKNPKSLIGVDISKELIKIATQNFGRAKFYVMDAEKLTFDDQSFDFVYSSLLLDYFESWDVVLGQVFRVLRHGGAFLFSNIHPVKWGAEATTDEDGKKIGALLGFAQDHKTGKQHIYGDYLNTVLHQETWMKSIPIYYYSKPVSDMFNAVISAGLVVQALYEPKAIPETKGYDPEYWEINQKIPNFIIFETKKP